MQNRTALTVFFVRVVFVLFETHRFCYAARLVFPDLIACTRIVHYTIFTCCLHVAAEYFMLFGFIVFQTVNTFQI